MFDQGGHGTKRHKIILVPWAMGRPGKSLKMSAIRRNVLVLKCILAFSPHDECNFQLEFGVQILMIFILTSFILTKFIKILKGGQLIKNSQHFQTMRKEKRFLMNNYVYDLMMYTMEWEQTDKQTHTYRVKTEQTLCIM